jgi:hypothetical protein
MTVSDSECLVRKAFVAASRCEDYRKVRSRPKIVKLHPVGLHNSRYIFQSLVWLDARNYRPVLIQAKTWKKSHLVHMYSFFAFYSFLSLSLSQVGYLQKCSRMCVCSSTSLSGCASSMFQVCNLFSFSFWEVEHWLIVEIPTSFVN